MLTDTKYEQSAARKYIVLVRFSVEEYSIVIPGSSHQHPRYIFDTMRRRKRFFSRGGRKKEEIITGNRKQKEETSINTNDNSSSSSGAFPVPIRQQRGIMMTILLMGK